MTFLESGTDVGWTIPEMAGGNEESHEEKSVYPVSNRDLNPESPECKTRILAIVL
jgi:hypothetical protein